MGISIFLLVSIRLGYRNLSVAGDCVPQAEDLEIGGGRTGRLAGSIVHAALPPSREDAARQQHTGALHEGGLLVRVVVRSWGLSRIGIRRVTAGHSEVLTTPWKVDRRSCLTSI